jgi:pimeloyl-ACP methyl ester carboxylesterase
MIAMVGAAAATRGMVVMALLPSAVAIPAEPHWFDGQIVDHFATDTTTFRQRFYQNDTCFQGPGSPIFVILGGEGGIPPETGIYYPWITDILAKNYGALVVEPEHRFYGESLPFADRPFAPEHLRLLTSQQALADAANFIRAQQAARNCTARGTAGYCPVLTIGGSYPGWLSAMMRIRYPSVVDMAYSASAPMRFYSQQVTQYEYYARVTASAERSMPGCPEAVRGAFEMMQAFFANATVEQVVRQFSLFTPLPEGVAKDPERLADDLFFLAEQTFANLNMANYPPTNATGLHRVCESFVAAWRAGGSAPLAAMRGLLLTHTAKMSLATAGRAHIRTECLSTAKPAASFDLGAHLPAGPHATARCGDWSGCGTGQSGEMWDYQTCTFEVEHIGFGGAAQSQMFPPRPWTREWLEKHCEKRFGVKPQPFALEELWGFDEANIKAQASRIIFTQGLNDGWSVGGFPADLDSKKGLISINMPNGAHHSDLSHDYGRHDTPDVQAAHARINSLVGQWLEEVRSGSNFAAIII